MEEFGCLSVEKYRERVSVLRYSIAFSGAASAFLVKARVDLGFALGGKCLLHWTLFCWGMAIVTGFLAYVLSYREVWYHQREGRDGSHWHRTLRAIEVGLVYVSLTLHVFLMIGSNVLTAIVFWRS
jgi:hypothetical protein